MTGEELKILAFSILAAVILTAIFGTSSISRSYGVNEFTLTPVKDEIGTPETQAGAHPFAVEQRISFETKEDPGSGEEVPDGATKDLEVEVPPGLLGSPEATERCSGPDFINVIQEDKIPHCKNAAVVGVVTAEVEHEGNFASFPLYNLQAPEGMPQKLGFIALTVPVSIAFELKSTPPYNAIAKVSYTSQVVPFYGAVVRVWGNPADHAHDPYRGSCLDTTDKNTPELVSKGLCEAEIPEKPFLTLPRSCTGPLQTSFRATSWQGPKASGFDIGPPPVSLEGCDALGLDPLLSLAPTTAAAESASGLDVDLAIEDPGISSPSEGAQQSDIRKSVIALPPGMSANPSAAEGLAACSPAGYAQEALNQAPELGCPEASKVGELEVETPLFEDKVLGGSIYLAEQDNNPFNSFLALYFVIKDPELGILAKLAARGELDPVSGQITTIVEEMPQAPISKARFHIFDGPRGSLITPSTCGPHTAQAQFTSWAGGDPVQIPTTFTIGSGAGGGDCPTGAPFGPRLSAGSANPTGGEHSSFLTRITRSDGEQEITRIDATLPPGLLAKIAGVPQCPGNAAAIARAKSGRQEQADPSCPANTQIGRTMAGAGVGSELTYVPGKVYLGGPFAGNKLSLIAITPAVTGPFDAGTVALQMGITVDPNTYRGKIDASSAEPIPRILKGIPLRARDIRVFVDRPNFTLNPTSCDPFATDASFLGSGGAQASASDRFQATGCQRLPFKPKLALSLKGGTKRGDHPAFKAVLTPRPGDANLGRAVTTLPPSEFIDNAHIQNPCTRVQFNANQCPKGSILGTAIGYSPLLEEPLEGLVYFRSNGGERLLPDIVLDLNGLFHVTVVGFVDSKKARLRTTFAFLPDAPISKAVIQLKGGKKGLLVNNRDLCAHKLRAKVAFTAQNNKFLESQPVVKTSCKGGGGKGKGGKGAKRGG